MICAVKIIAAEVDLSTWVSLRPASLSFCFCYQLYHSRQFLFPLELIKLIKGFKTITPPPPPFETTVTFFSFDPFVLRTFLGLNSKKAAKESQDRLSLAAAGKIPDSLTHFRHFSVVCLSWLHHITILEVILVIFHNHAREAIIKMYLSAHFDLVMEPLFALRAHWFIKLFNFIFSRFNHAGSSWLVLTKVARALD